MFSRSVFSRNILLHCPFPRSCGKEQTNSLIARFSTGFKLKNMRKRSFLLAGVPITAAGAGYYFYKTKQLETNNFHVIEFKGHTLLENKPDVPISRTVPGALTNTDLNLTLYQYPTCPFCCKVRAFLDYYGLPYDVVEVDPVLRQQTSWTTYKKVPILLAKVENGYQQLNDSSMIISALNSYILDGKKTLEKIVNYYPISDVRDKDGVVKPDILNKYFLMYGENFNQKNKESILEEKKWREWADNSLVHVLSPNVYRTFGEAMQAFNWFSEVGEWDRLFPAWERNIIVYAGASAMYFIGKRLRKRHHLKEDVRESLYDEGRKWMKALAEKKTPFMGGDSPNLADLAVYGVLSSIEGCLAFKDLLNRTSIGNWYFKMKEAVKNHEGKNKIKL